jgi:hypothetical protein
MKISNKFTSFRLVRCILGRDFLCRFLQVADELCNGSPFVTVNRIAPKNHAVIYVCFHHKWKNGFLRIMG